MVRPRVSPLSVTPTGGDSACGPFCCKSIRSCALSALEKQVSLLIHPPLVSAVCKFLLLISGMIALLAGGGYQRSPGFSWGCGGGLRWPLTSRVFRDSVISPVPTISLYDHFPLFYLLLPQEEGSGMARILRCEIQCHPFLTERPRVSAFTSESLSFLLCSKSVC